MTSTPPRPAAHPQVVVGVDPAAPQLPALTWAADEAARRCLPLRLVVSVPPLHDTQHVDTVPHYMSLQAQGDKALVQAAATAGALHPGLTTVTELADGVPAAVLCRRAEQHGGLVVVGSRRLGRAAELFSASSVALPVSARAGCPVVVVPDTGPATDAARFVVGVDGSDGARSALAFAFQEAGLRQAEVLAVWAWRQPLVRLGDDTEGLAERQRFLAEAVAGHREAYPDVPLSTKVVRGHPVEELGRLSAAARAVVVGRRGRGGWTGMRIGSVAHGLLHRAESTVIVVPERVR
ncbi:universal stress protein [Streptomyces solincola]|uniref:Universal stress protein n=1 Tax=Streptomyces solincola TaxID=2100817 RepID=A0A2S9Q2A8_9ACTN|nr:universal stress protein [Streptomyces solincola]PRH80768.1 universal stress protein [Streptomyces solincola]